MTTVATFLYPASGQVETLKRDSTLILGRNTFNGITSAHISRKQVLITSKGDEITITNLGTNRSLLNGRPFSKEMSLYLKDEDVITLVETPYRVLVQIPKKNTDLLQDNHGIVSKLEPSTTATTTSAAVIPPTGNTKASESHLSSPLRQPPPPFQRSASIFNKKLDFSSAFGTDNQVTNSSKVQKSIMASTAAVVVSTTAAVDAIATHQEHTNVRYAYNDPNMMGAAIENHDDDLADNTSESDRDEDVDRSARSSDISDESSFICEDLSDNDSFSDTMDGL
ncbi:hypothetical protein FBU30_011299 [Linnemannia zychae]|nr:hypothetical protein FBU30_011299 [Linnemannia zychae]